MAFIACKDCGTEISSNTELCPRCGRRQERRSVLRRIAPYLFAGFGAFIASAIIGVFLEERSRSADQHAMLAAIFGTFWPLVVIVLIAIIVVVMRN